MGPFNSFNERAIKSYKGFGGGRKRRRKRQGFSGQKKKRKKNLSGCVPSRIWKRKKGKGEGNDLS